MSKVKQIVDTTLRDGEQCPGVAFRQEDKIRLAQLIDQMGVYEIEAGIANGDMESRNYISKILENRDKAKISVWSRMTVEDMKEACSMEPDIIHIGVPVSYVQIYSKLKKNKIWVQKNATACIEIANQKGIPVTIGLEDATRADVGFIISLIKKCNEMGVVVYRIADTVGALAPDRAENLVREILSCGREIQLEIHEHNDLGMAVANSIVMAKAGGEFIDCTLLGIGERVGNCNIRDFVHAAERIFDIGINKSKLEEAEQELIYILNQGIQ